MCCVLSELMSQRLLAAVQLFCVLQRWNAASAEAIVRLRPAGELQERSLSLLFIHTGSCLYSPLPLI